MTPTPTTVARPDPRAVAQRAALVPLLGLAIAIAGLHALGTGPLAAPPVGSLDALDGWLRDRGAVTAAFALLRLVALGLAYHLLACSLLAGLARAVRRPDLARLALRLTLPPLRGAVRRTVSLGLSAGLVLATPLPSAAREPAPPTTTTTDADADGTAVLRLDDPDGTAVLRLEPAPPTTTGAAGTPTAPGSHPSTSSSRPAEPADRPATSQPGATSTAPSAPDRERPDASEIGPAVAATPLRPATPADPAPPTEPAAAGARDHVVEPGDHLWSLAEQRLTEALARPVTDAEVAPYWRRVVAANPQLTDPDLVFPGDAVHLPAP